MSDNTQMAPEAIKELTAKIAELSAKAVGKEELEGLKAQLKEELAAWRVNDAQRAPEAEPEAKQIKAASEAQFKALAARKLATPSKREQDVELQRMADTCHIVASLLRHARSGDSAEPVSYGETMKSLRCYEDFRSALGKAMDTSSSNVGADFIPTGFSANLIDQIRLEHKVAGLFNRFTMPTNPFTLPVAGSDQTGYLMAEATSDTFLSAATYTALTPATTNLTFTAKALGSMTLFSAEISEDSIIPIADFIRGQIAISQARAEEDAILNGDTTATSANINGTAIGSSSTSAKKAWYGLRYDAKAGGASADLSTLTLDAIRSLRAEMGKYGVYPSELAYVVPISVYFKLQSLADSAGTRVFTSLDKYGPAATALTGELGKLDGSPIIVSELLPENLNSTGEYDGSTTTKTVLLVVNKRCFAIGDRRQMAIDQDRIIWTDQSIMVVKRRLHFQQLYASAKCAALGYNITVA